MTRRSRTMWPTLAFVSCFMIAGYGYYMYNELTQKLRLSETRVEKYEKRHSSMKSQLQVVYEHKAKLEGTLSKERQDHITEKQELLGKVKEYDGNLTRTKHEAFNRFNALDTQHKMLKAKHDELSGDYNRMQQQYVRLGDDHRVVVANLKDDYQKLKDAKEKESKALQERIQELYNENEFMRSDLKHNQKNYEEEKRSSEICLEDLKKAQSEKRALSSVLAASNDKVASLKKLLKAKQALCRRQDGPSPRQKSKVSVSQKKSKPSENPTFATSPLPSLVPTTLASEVRDMKKTAPNWKLLKKQLQRPGDRKSTDLRVKNLLIRNQAVKKEDSIKDQYYKDIKDKSTLDEDLSEADNRVPQKETVFQDLVEKRDIIQGNEDQEEPKVTTARKDKYIPTNRIDGNKGENKTTRRSHAYIDTTGDKENEVTVEKSAKRYIKFQNSDTTKTPTQKTVTQKDSAGREFMKKQLHLRLQERKDLSDVQRIDSKISTTTNDKDIDKTHEKLKAEEGRIVKANRHEERRQLQPPGNTVKEAVKDIDSGKIENPHQVRSRNENQNPKVASIVKNSPVASPLKDKNRKEQVIQRRVNIHTKDTPSKRSTFYTTKVQKEKSISKEVKEATGSVTKSYADKLVPPSTLKPPVDQVTPAKRIPTTSINQEQEHNKVKRYETDTDNSHIDNTVDNTAQNEEDIDDDDDRSPDVNRQKDEKNNPENTEAEPIKVKEQGKAKLQQPLPTVDQNQSETHEDDEKVDQAVDEDAARGFEQSLLNRKKDDVQEDNEDNEPETERSQDDNDERETDDSYPFEGKPRNTVEDNGTE